MYSLHTRWVQYKGSNAHKEWNVEKEAWDTMTATYMPPWQQHSELNVWPIALYNSTQYSCIGGRQYNSIVYVIYNN